MTTKMPMQCLGRTGLQVSRLSYGSWVTFKAQIGAPTAYDIMARAYAAGVNFFDNAEAYSAGGAETVMGEAIATGIEKKTWRREDLVISTKLFFGAETPGPNGRGLSRKHIVEGLRASLKRMRLDYVDLVFCHRPDPVTPIEETVRAMNWVIDQGLAFYWGTSEWTARDVTEACRIADLLGMIRPAFEQPEYSIVSRQRVEHEYAPLYRDYGYGLTTWSPLASGVLTGKYSGKVAPPGSRLTLKDYQFLVKSKFEGDDAWQVDAADAMMPIAAELGCSLAQLSIAWVLSNPKVSTCILGATSLEQLDDNLGALRVVPLLTPSVLARIDAAATPASLVKPIRSEVMISSVRGLDGISNLDLGRLSASRQ